MRIIDMRPEVTPFSNGKRLHCGKAWHAHDYTELDNDYRDIYHYAVLMGRYGRISRDVNVDDQWVFTPISIGIGSVSDQGGMNQLMSATCKWETGGTKMYKDYGYYYSRANDAPRIIKQYNNDVVVG